MIRKITSKPIVFIVIVCVVTILSYNYWWSTPNTALNQLYDESNSSENASIKELGDYLYSLKEAGYYKPDITKRFLNFKWEVHIDMYKYNTKDGGVEDVKSLRVVLSMKPSLPIFLPPEINHIENLIYKSVISRRSKTY